MMFKVCTRCNNPIMYPQSRYCMYCGAPLQTGTPFTRFIIAMLKCLGFYAAMQIIPGIISAVYSMAVGMTLPQQTYISEEAYTKAFWAEFSKHGAVVLIVGDILLIGALVLFYRIIHKRLTGETCVSRMPVVSFGGVVLLGVFAQFAVTTVVSLFYALFPAAQNLSPDIGTNYEQMFGGGSLIMEIAYIAVITPITEEIIFRGLMFTRLRGVVGRRGAIIMSALLFGAAHLPGGGIEQFSYTFLLGIVLAAAFDKYNSLWASVAIHFGFNAANYSFNILPLSTGTQFIALMLISVGAVLLLLAFIFFTKPIYKTENQSLERNVINT